MSEQCLPHNCQVPCHWCEFEAMLDKSYALESLVKQLEQNLDAEISKVDALEKVAESVMRQVGIHGIRHFAEPIEDALRAAGYLGEGR